MNDKVIWVFQDKAVRYECTSFPYAFRMMHTAMKKGAETNRTMTEMRASMFITSPLNKKYSVFDARQMALDQGLLDAEGELNGKEFKRKR